MSSPADRSLAANIAAATRWATCPDRTAATKPARDGLRARFAREVDPDGMLTSAEREYRVDQMMRAHMLRMSIASKKARAEKAVRGKGPRTTAKTPQVPVPEENGSRS